MSHTLCERARRRDKIWDANKRINESINTQTLQVKGAVVVSMCLEGTGLAEVLHLVLSVPKSLTSCPFVVLCAVRGSFSDVAE